jgi:hypothetical protein
MSTLTFNKHQLTYIYVNVCKRVCISDNSGLNVQDLIPTEVCNWFQNIEIRSGITNMMKADYPIISGITNMVKTIILVINNTTQKTYRIAQYTDSLNRLHSSISTHKYTVNVFVVGLESWFNSTQVIIQGTIPSQRKMICSTYICFNSSQYVKVFLWSSGFQSRCLPLLLWCQSM